MGIALTSHHSSPVSLPSSSQDRDIKTEEQAMDFGREYFGQMMAKALFVPPSSMDDEGEGVDSTFIPMFRQEYGNALAKSGAFDREAREITRWVLDAQDVRHTGDSA